MSAPTSRDRTADDPPEDRLGISGTQVLAGVLASVSAAVVSSFFGVAGTIVGAAVVSVVATVAGAAYNQGIRRTQARLQQLQSLRLTMPGRRLRPDEAGGDEVPFDADVPAGDEAEAGEGRLVAARRWLGRHRLGLAGGAALVFALSLAIVTGLELLGDRPLSGQSSAGDRTSIGSLFSGGGAGSDGSGGEGGDTGDVDGSDDGVTTTLPSGGSGTDQQPTTSVGDGSGTDRQNPTGPPATGDTTTSTTTPTTTGPPAPTDGETAPTTEPSDPGSSAGRPATGADAASGTEAAVGVGWQTAPS